MPRTVRRRRGAAQARGDRPEANIAQQARQAPLRQQAPRGDRARGIEQRHPHRAVVSLADPPDAGPIPRWRGRPAVPTSTTQQALVPEDPATTFSDASPWTPGSGSGISFWSRRGTCVGYASPGRPAAASVFGPGAEPVSVTRRPGRPAAEALSASGPGAELVPATRHPGRPAAASASVLDAEPVPGARRSGRPAAFRADDGAAAMPVQRPRDVTSTATRPNAQAGVDPQLPRHFPSALAGAAASTSQQPTLQRGRRATRRGGGSRVRSTSPAIVPAKRP
ncbi:hypothetical protein QAD02_008272 [Eretmocerus hayati]|uniref:Uncharacterized protein n=1 Tax=Eretmocerus hayati TaxID=131215 RepID=A0ACC2N5Y9_9HYME|nr:hypothetical protein QAD02_008272 [Eretmocerus hayati]